MKAFLRDCEIARVLIVILARDGLYHFAVLIIHYISGFKFVCISEYNDRMIKESQIERYITPIYAQFNVVYV